MVIHDSNTEHTSGKEYVVKDIHSDNLRQLEVGSYKGEKYKDDKIPFLEEVLEIVLP